MLNTCVMCEYMCNSCLWQGWLLKRPMKVTAVSLLSIYSLHSAVILMILKITWFSDENESQIFHKTAQL